MAMSYEVFELENGRWTWEIYQEGQESIPCGKEFSSEEAARRNLMRRLDPARHVMVKPAQSKGRSVKR